MAPDSFAVMMLMFPLGFFVATLGTLVGAGGGFLLMPVLMALYPSENAERLTAISLAMIFANSLSGSIAYIRMRRVDFRSGIAFMLAALPGAYLGARATNLLNRLLFDRVLGAALVVLACFLLTRGYLGKRALKKVGGAAPDVGHAEFHASRAAIAKGSLLSSFVGFISSLLGIGGGIIHVPALIFLLGFPVHVATATSHFVLACTSGIAVFEHFQSGDYAGSLPLVLPVAVGAVCGAQVGARLSKRVKGQAILTGLAVALAIAGARLFLRSFVSS